MQETGRHFATLQSSGAILDVLPHIFTYALPIYDSLTEIPVPSRFSSPLTISHVCRSWRDVALATPSLWSAIRFQIDDKAQDWDYNSALRYGLGWGNLFVTQSSNTEQSDYEMECKRRTKQLWKKLEWLEICIERSGLLPLDLCIAVPELQEYGRLHYDEGTTQRVKNVLEVLIDQRNRWRSVKMDIHLSMLPFQGPGSLLSDGSRVIDNVVLDNLECAQCLSIRFYALSPYRDAEIIHPIYLDLSRSSNLRTLEFRGPMPRFTRIPSEGRIRATEELGLVKKNGLSQLKRVEITSGYQFTLARLTDFLNSAPWIEEIVGVLPYHIDILTPVVGRPLVLPHLRMLILQPTFGTQMSGVHIVSALLSMLIAPALRTFQLGLPQRQVDAENVGRGVLEFISRSRMAASNETVKGSGIRNLILSGTLHGRWLVDSLPHLHCLRTLTLIVSYESEACLDGFLRALTVPISGVTSSSCTRLPCPQLTELSIASATLCEDLVGSLLDTRTRVHPHNEPLKNVTFRQCRFVRPGGGGFGRGRGGNGDGMQLFMKRQNVRASLRRGLKIVFA